LAVQYAVSVRRSLLKFHFFAAGSVSFVSDSNPRIATVLDQMRAVYRLLSVPREGAEQLRTRPLTRLHLHTLAYQVQMGFSLMSVLREGADQLRTRPLTRPHLHTLAYRYQVQMTFILLSVLWEGAEQQRTRPLTRLHLHTLAYRVLMMFSLLYCQSQGRGRSNSGNALL
jgi:ADP-specific Phosphofructokinase/Glucokinase conserved region